MRIKEITPARFRCVVGGCPQIHALENNQYLIVGKKVPKPLIEQIGAERIAEDEYAILVDVEMIDDAVKK